MHPKLAAVLRPCVSLKYIACLATQVIMAANRLLIVLLVAAALCVTQLPRGADARVITFMKLGFVFCATA